MSNDNDTAKITYENSSISVEEDIQLLAKQLTNNSQISYSNEKSEKNNQIKREHSLTSTATSDNIVLPFSTQQSDPRLDPNSDQFSSKHWIKNFKSFIELDPNHYKPYSLGIIYKNLRAYGIAADADYQTTVLNAPLKIGQHIIKQFRSKEDKQHTQFDILKPMDALIKPGELVVVLGRPGSGCSTLLKTIATNTHGFHVDEKSVISYEGLNQDDVRNHYRGEVIYSAESDVHFPHLTVQETLLTTAKFRTPQNRIPGISRDDYASVLTDVYLATYGLSHTKNTKVGNELVRGVSGGERKRVSIAEVSLSGAKLQCWDNATRGLDAATALEFIRALRTSADILETSALVAIYQCSQDAYDLFDKVSLLYEGYQIFFGRADQAKDFFIRMGYECPSRQTTADFLTSITSPRERIVRKSFERKVPRTPKEFETYWKRSPEYARLIKNIDVALQENEVDEVKHYIKEAHKARQSNHIRHTSPYTVSYWMQTRYLLVREWQRIKNDLGFHIGGALGNGLMALVIASIFFNLQNTSASMSTRGAALFFAVLINGFSSMLEIMSLYEARPIIEKHKQYALYHPSAAQLASVISQVPFKILTALIFNLIYYFMVNFRREPGRFFFYFLVNITGTFSMSHMFRLTGAATRTFEEAMVYAHVMLLTLTIFVGYTIPVTYMLGWSRWINYINPLAYAFESLMANEFADREFECSSYVPRSPFQDSSLPSDSFVCNAVSSVRGETTVNGSAYIESAYLYFNSNKWRNFCITLAFAAIFLIVYLVFSEYNESAKQKGEIILFQRSTLQKLKKKHGVIKNDLEAGYVEKNKGITHDGDVSDEGESVELNQPSVGNAIQTGERIFHWRDVHYTIKIKKEEREILNGVDGWVRPGTLTALMGASGAGKTTLLDVLANRVTTGVVTGNMFVNGRLRDSSFQRSTGYVQQQDLHLSTTTVREALKFSAYLRQPFEVSKADKDAYVEEVIKILDMEKYADAIVGVAGEGLNVEQRKRLTIGVELVAKPKLLLFLDEPTSGLDSQTAWSICQLMRKLANHGQAILCTIHQPSAILMKEFDRLLFLASGGRTVYFGDLGENCQTLIDYFEKYGAPKCPADANPAEWMLHVIGAAPGSHANQDYHQVWLDSSEHEIVLNELDKMEVELSKIDNSDELTPNHLKEFAAPLWYQTLLVIRRVLQQYWRTPTYIWPKISLAVISSLFIGFSFFKAGSSTQGLTNQMMGLFMYTTIFNPLLQQILPNFIRQRNLYENRERPSKTFSWKAFMISQMVSEIPWNIFIGTLAFFCFYYPPAFYQNAAPNGTGEVNSRGVYAWLFSVLFFVYIGTMALLCVAPAELADSAGNTASMLFSMCLIFCGALVGPKALPKFWIFMYRVSPLTYFIDGFLSNALAHNTITCAENELVVLNPKAGETCKEWFASYISQTGTGYLVDEDAVTNCQFCPFTKTDDFLRVLSLNYDLRWRNLGIFISYIIFNIAAAIFLYWLARVPKKNKTVQEAPHTPRTQQPIKDSDEKGIK